MRPALRFALSALLAAIAASPAQAQLVYYATPVAGPVAAMPATGPATGVAVGAMLSPFLTAASGAPVAAAPIVHPSAGSGPVVHSFYQIKQGGRLDTVARRVGVSLADLVRLNPLLNPQERLSAGTLVALPIP